MDPRQLRALDHPLLIKGWIEKADVIGNGAGEELILLHHRSDVLAIGPGPDRCEGDAIDQHLPSGRLQQPKHDLDKRRLARARWTHNGHEFPWLDDKADIFEDWGLRFGIAEEDVSKLDLAPDLPHVCQDLIMPALEWTQGDVSQALEVQFENAEVKSLFDQLDGLFSEVLLVTHKGEDHPNGQAVAQRQPGREIDRNDVLQREQLRSWSSLWQLPDRRFQPADQMPEARPSPLQARPC